MDVLCIDILDANTVEYHTKHVLIYWNKEEHRDKKEEVASQSSTCKLWNRSPALSPFSRSCHSFPIEKILPLQHIFRNRLDNKSSRLRSPAQPVPAALSVTDLRAPKPDHGRRSAAPHLPHTTWRPRGLRIYLVTVLMNPRKVPSVEWS